MPAPVRILVVDDDDHIRQSLDESFLACAAFAFAVTGVRSPREVVALFATEPRFDVAVIDLEYGSWLTAERRRDRQLRHCGHQIVIAVNCVYPNGLTLVYSAHPKTENVVRAMQLGATDFIPKVDCPPHQLVDRIVHSLHARREREEQRGVINAFVLDHQQEWAIDKATKVLAIVVEGDQAKIAAEGGSRLEALLNYEERRLSTVGTIWDVDPYLHTVSVGGSGARYV